MFVESEVLKAQCCALSNLSLPVHSNDGLKRPKPLLESYIGTTKKSGIFCKFVSPFFFETVSAAALLLELVVIVPVWAMLQLESFVTL